MGRESAGEGLSRNITDERSPSRFVLDSFFVGSSGAGMTAADLSSSRAAIRLDFARSLEQWRMATPAKTENMTQEKMMALMFPWWFFFFCAALSVLVAVAVLVVVVEVLVVVVELLVLVDVEEEVVDVEVESDVVVLEVLEVVELVVDVVELVVDVVELVVLDVVDVVDDVVDEVVDVVDVEDEEVVSRAKIAFSSCSSRISRICTVPSRSATIGGIASSVVCGAWSTAVGAKNG
jgi:hypothetical protein